MTRNLFILGTLLGLVLLAGALIQYRYQSYVERAPVEPMAPPPEFLPVELPAFERLRSPHAILVLDVSGSMKVSDPSHLQSEAVLQFYSVYRDLAREILAKGDAAQVAVVLFGTIAQTIDWLGNGDPWLDVSATNTATFRDAVDQYLGHPGTEPRTSQETDYLAAMDEVHRVVDGLPSPPAILFMTDGGNDPHILFTPGVPASQKAARLGALSGHQRQVFEDVASGRRRWLRPKSATPIFNRRAEGFDPAALTSAQMAVVRPSIGLAVSDLLARRYPFSGEHADAPPFWATVFLRGDSNAVSGADDVRELLAGPSVSGPWGDKRRFMECQDARQLPGFFVGQLADWLRLRELPVAPKSQGLQLPADTQAFAVTLETASGGGHLDLSSSGRVVPLSGRDGLWAGVASGGGTWRFQGDGGEVKRGRLFLRPRYEWGLSVPSRVSITGPKGNLDVRLFLFSLEEEKPVAAVRIYPDLPAALPMRIRMGGADHESECRRVTNGDPGSAAYEGSVPIDSGAPRQVSVEINLAPLRQHGISVSADRLSATAEIHPGLRLEISNPKGRRVAPDLRNVPREAEWVRRILSGWREHGK
jgi:hypothetical protein